MRTSTGSISVMKIIQKHRPRSGKRKYTTANADSSERAGRRSTIWASVLNLLLDVVELDHRQHDDDDHQHHRLGSRAAEVEGLEAVVVDLVDEDRRLLAGAALSGRVDDREGVEE